MFRWRAKQWKGTGVGIREWGKAGSLREAGEERAGDGIPKGAGVGRNRKLRNLLQKKKHTKVGTTKGGGGNREYKVREAENSDLMSPLP